MLERGLQLRKRERETFILGSTGAAALHGLRSKDAFGELPRRVFWVRGVNLPLAPFERLEN